MNLWPVNARTDLSVRAGWSKPWPAGRMRPEDGFCVAQENFVYIVYLIQKAQASKHTSTLLKVIATTTPLGKLRNIKVRVDMFLMWRNYAFLRFVTTKARVNFCLYCKHRLHNPVFPVFSLPRTSLKTWLT